MNAAFNVKLFAGLFTLVALLLADNLEYRSAGGGAIRVLVPKDFLYCSKNNYVPKPGEVAPDDYFFCSDTSKEIEFYKTPVFAKDLISLKPLFAESLKQEATKVYFNDTLTVNGIKMYVAECDKIDGGKMKHIKFFEFNVRDSTYSGGIGCSIKLKDQWMATGEKIFRSIKIN